MGGKGWSFFWGEFVKKLSRDSEGGDRSSDFIPSLAKRVHTAPGIPRGTPGLTRRTIPHNTRSYLRIMRRECRSRPGRGGRGPLDRGLPRSFVFTRECVSRLTIDVVHRSETPKEECQNDKDMDPLFSKKMSDQCPTSTRSL